MGNASQSGEQPGNPGDVSFTVYADFNCPFCYALNERMHAFNLEDRIDFRAVQHAPSISSDEAGLEVLSELSKEVAEARRRAPSIQVNIPLFRPNSESAALLMSAVIKSEPGKAGLLRRSIYRALWFDGQDISRQDVLDTILKDLGIKPPGDDAGRDDEVSEWQNQWDSSLEYDRDLPIVVSAEGDTLTGFPLEPELDAFLTTGSLIFDEALQSTDEQEPLQRILVLDDDVPSLRMIIEQMRDAQVEIIQDFKQLVDATLNHGMPDLVMLNEPLLEGVVSADWLRSSTVSDLDATIPIIFVSDDKSTEAEVAAFAAGAADFIARPFHPRILQARMNTHLQARRFQQQLNNIARVDALTSVCNRREFDVRLRSEWGRGARTGQPLGLLMIDVDKFKEYNDHNGHLRGDDCLVTVAQILTTCMQREGDLLARYGGEEFVALLPRSDIDGALKVANDCLVAIAKAEMPHGTSNVEPFVTVSIGVATMEPIYEKSSTLLIEQADIALYQAKQDGRNRICTFEHSG